MQIILTQKTDLEAADDAKLADRELQALVGAPLKTVRPSEAARVLGIERPPAAWSKRTLASCEIRPSQLDMLLRRLAFWDTIFWRAEDRASTNLPARSVSGVSFCLTLSCLLESTVRLKDPDDIIAHVEQLSTRLAPTHSGLNGNGQPSPAVRRKNDYLSHPIHKYKAKFFPRLARSLVNIVCPKDDSVVLDPFSGSGTAPLEASLMGVRSVGFDIDPLSVFIGRVKCELEEIDPRALSAARDELRGAILANGQLGLFGAATRKRSKANFKVPAFLIVRNPVRFPLDAVAAFEADTNALLAAINGGFEGTVRDWLLLALSHALATKISLRWMGTGDDRFALEVAKRSLRSIFVSHLDLMVQKAQVYRALREARVLPALAPTKFDIQDATCASSLRRGSIDGIVTSPPYLPAASGRETYLRSRAISLIALGLLSEAEVLERERDIIGSILASPTLAPDAVPESVQKLTVWMSDQRARGPKSQPTVAYFENLGASLREMRRVLKPGGRAAIVVSKYHRFYELVTRKVVWEFNMSEAVAEVASEPRYGVGLTVDEVVDIELPKMDYVARPGARGSYHESIVFLRRS